MRLAYLASVRFPSERAHAAQIAHMCRAFVDAGATVDLYVSPRHGRASTQSVAAYFAIPVAFDVRPVRIDVFSRWFAPAFYLNEVFFVLQALVDAKRRSVHHDIYYFRSEWIGWLLSFAVAPARLVWESHEARFSYPARRILRQGVRTVVISEGLRDFYRERGVPPEQLHVAHDAIDDSFFEAAESKRDARVRLGLPLDVNVALYIGGLDTWKGVETYFKAAAHAPEVHLAVIGGSRAEVEHNAAMYPDVHFLGARPYRELRDNQQAADVLVVPNTAANDLSARYTSPLKVFAHLASCVPLVLSDIPSLRAIVPDDAAYWFTADDPEELARVVRRVLDDPEQARACASRARQHAHQYTWHQRAAQILAFLRGVPEA